MEGSPNKIIKSGLLPVFSVLLRFLAIYYQPLIGTLILLNDSRIKPSIFNVFFLLILPSVAKIKTFQWKILFEFRGSIITAGTCTKQNLPKIGSI